MNENMIVLAILVGVIGVAALVIFVKKKYSIDEKLFDNISSTLDIADLILEIININDAVKNKTKFILDLSDIVSEYIFELSLDDEDKETLSLQVFNDLIAKFDILLDENEMKLVKIIIKESLEWLEKQEEKVEFIN